MSSSITNAGNANVSTASATAAPAALPAQLPGSMVLLLRLDGLAVATATALLYARTGASWWLFAAVWLAPDISMLGYLAGPCRGARWYNAFHTYFLPLTLGVLGLLLHADVAVAVALIWANHIGVDRVLGYGLKHGVGFGWTHLGKHLGRHGRG